MRSLVPHDASLLSIELRTERLASPEGLVLDRSGRLSHVQICDEHVSRHQLRPKLVNGAISVKDLNSTRGILVQGQAATLLDPVKLGADSVRKIAD